jgi:hypothetical protein
MNRSGPGERCKTGHFVHAVHHRCVQDSVSVSALVASESARHQWPGICRRNADRFEVPSFFYKHKFEEWGWPVEQLTCIPNSVRIDELVPVTEPDDYFVYFSRLAIESGFGTLRRRSTRPESAW